MDARHDVAFSPSFGNRPTHLVGRESLIESMVAGLSTNPGGKERALVLLGQRGSGKTVMLWEFADRAREAGFVVANPTAVREGLVSRMVEKLQDDAAGRLRSHRQLAGGSIGALGFSAGVSFAQGSEGNLSPEGRLNHLVRDLSGKGIGTLLLVDELQANSSEVRAVVGTYQEMVGEGLDVAIALAGLPSAVSGVLNDHVLTFLNRARKATLEPLAVGEVDAFYRGAFEACGVAIDAQLRRKAAARTQGSPYFMQLIGHYIVRYADDRGIADDEVVAEAVESASAEFRNDICKTTLAALSAGDVDYLRAMASVANEGIASTSAIAQALGVSSDYGQQYRRRLIDAGVIQVARRGAVEFTVPLLRDYLVSQEV